MTALYITAAGPAGPCRIETAAPIHPAAHVEDLGALDVGQVAAAAREALKTAAVGDGWYRVPVATVRGAVEQAKAAALVRDGRMAMNTNERFFAPGTPAPAREIATDNYAGTMPGEGLVRSAGSFAPKCTRERAREADARNSVRAIRAGLGMTQEAFAKAFGLALATVRDWEQGRSAPDHTARSFLRVIEHRPDVVRRVLETTEGP